MDNDFGAAIAAPLDIDQDGVLDIVVGEPGADQGGTNRGRLEVLFLATDGTPVLRESIGSNRGGFSGDLDNHDTFGASLAALGDLDGDGAPDLAAGAPSDDDGEQRSGAVWVLFLDASGLVRSQAKISNESGGFPGVLREDARFGSSLAFSADIDGDGVGEILAGAPFDDDGGSHRGAVWLLFLRQDGTLTGGRKLSSTEGGFTGLLKDEVKFGSSVASIGDLDGDAVPDIAVGAPEDDDGEFNTGAIWILFLAADGSVKAHQKISALEGSFPGELLSRNLFGAAVASPGDLDLDGIPDIAVGAPGDGAPRNTGAVWLLYLEANGEVKSATKINNTEGGFTGVLHGSDEFGSSLAWLTDLDGDGLKDLAVGSPGDGTSDREQGAIWILFLDADGTVKSEKRTRQ